MFRKKKPHNLLPASTLDVEAGICLDSVSVTVEGADSPLTILSEVSVKLTQPRTAVLGLNGSGKSTFLKLLNGLQSASNGTVTVGGVSVAEDPATLRRKVGMLFANPQAQLVMPTGIEDVELSLRTEYQDAAARRVRAQEILDSLGVGHRAHHSVYDLSGGERQLLALATVLAVKPDFLLLDEPTTLLDQRNRHRFYRLIDTLTQRLLISTHDLDLAARCQEAIVIHRGSIIAQGEAQEMIELYRSWCETEFPGETGAR